MYNENTYYDKINSGNKNAWIYLHGLPGQGAMTAPVDTIKLTENLRNVFNNLDYDLYLPRYQGIKPSKGSFSFSSTISASKDFIKKIQKLNQYETISVIGHSWGGLVLSLILSDIQKTCILDKLLFLTPFCFIPPKNIAQKLLTELEQEVPLIFQKDHFSNYLKELDSIRNDLLNTDITMLTKHTKNYCILALQDESIPLSITKEFCAQLTNPLQIEINSNHNFQKKTTSLLKELLKVIQQ